MKRRRSFDPLTGLGAGFVAVVFAGILSLIGYGVWFEVNDPGHGQITKREYIPATTSCSGTNPIVCTSNPECYRIAYTDGKHDGDACVSPLDYDRYEIGGYYPRGWEPK